MDFAVEVVTLSHVKKHENADSLDIARIQGYECVVRKDQYHTGDLAVYIPEGSVLPEGLLKELDLWNQEAGKGKLSGSRGNRLKAVRLRGVVSQGLLAPVPPGLSPGDDAAAHYGIVKYIPEIPVHMRGMMTPSFGYTPAYDIENILKYPDVLQDGEDVAYTEKIHGTLACYALVPGMDNESLINGNTIIASKSMLGHSSFKNAPENDNNLYVNTFRKKLLDPGVWVEIGRIASEEETSVTIFGEIFGRGVQDLHYGCERDKDFRVFDIHVGPPGEGWFLNPGKLRTTATSLGLTTVPLLHEGLHSEELLRRFRDGRDSISGSHVREGIVINPLQERQDEELGRVKLKAVSPDYLFRKGNQTEFS